jgi:glucans biosynthesis protein
MGRVALGALLILLALAPPPLIASPLQFGFEDVYAIARQLAARPYQPPHDRIPPVLRQLGYDQYQAIRYKPQRALWRDEGPRFQVQFFLTGYLFSHPVAVNVIDASGVHRVPFSPDLFAYGKARLPEPLPATAGFAGFRLHYPINNPSTADEFVVFLGASYFRATGRGQSYGLSARGLAMNTAEPGGEEFPAFVEFWLRRPAPSARTVTVYALLDGPSATGAYQFEIAPGGATRIDVTAAIFFRRRAAVLGMAPLSSMFFHGKNTIRAFGDFRPEVHDSDGLLLASGTGEWIWRPLVNPQSILVSSFSLSGPKGFGLMQRDRAFDHYQDLQARYDIRPSVWIVPHGDWGRGQVRLFEMPTEHEYADNIVAMWVPAQQPPPGTPIRFAYGMVWGAEDGALPQSPGGRAVATRVGGARPGDHSGGAPAQVFVVDFAGNALNALPATASVQAIINAGPGGTIAEQHVQKNPVTGEWRASFRVQFAGKSPVDLRCFLKRGSDVLTETWSYLAQQ